MARPNLFIGLPAADRLGAGDPQALVDMCRRAEDAGADGVVLADHVLLGKHVDRYPWGTFPFPPDVTVAGAAHDAHRGRDGRRSRIKLTTGILIVPLRPAALLAKTVATLDVLSGGRLELGVGTGWQEEELAAQGIDFAAARAGAHRLHRRLPRALCDRQPGELRVASRSRSTTCGRSPSRCAPGGPPVLFSGTLNARNIRRIVELGDGWIPIMGETQDGIAAGIERLRDDVRGRGTCPRTCIVRAPLPVAKGDDGRRCLDATLDGSRASSVRSA